MRRRAALLLILLAACSSSAGRSATATSEAAGGGGRTAAHFTISGHAMDPTATDGDTALVDETAYESSTPQRGDVIVFATQEASGSRTLIKRVVALPGQTIEYHNCSLFIDGELVPEQYVDLALMDGICGADQATLTLPADQYFTMGDNRGGSRDSRDLGPIRITDIVGRVTAVIDATGAERQL